MLHACPVHGGEDHDYRLTVNLQGAAGQCRPEDHHHPRRHAASGQPGAARQAPRLAAQEGWFGNAGLKACMQRAAGEL